MGEHIHDNELRVSRCEQAATGSEKLPATPTLTLSRRDAKNSGRP
jgi:hypothetical protein